MEHFYKNIQGWFDYEDVYEEVVANLPNNSHIVEVGCWRGKSTSFLAIEIINSGKNIKLDCVDTWRGSIEHSLSNADQFDELYNSFLSNIEPVKQVLTPIRMSSIEASKLYPDESLDFVFIDAAHDYENVKLDIQHWYPKVKINGILAGHDYEPSWPGVVTAVNEMFLDKNLSIQNISWIHKKY